MYRAYLKRITDIILSLILFGLLIPVILTITLILFVTNKGKPFFIQRRPGMNGSVFKVIKFKTMNESKDSFNNLLPDDQRLTLVGKILRKTSLDELPQLINVITGDMSLVGPRPLLTEYLPLYNSLQKRRHEVRPGMTGWAQVNGRNSISWEERFRYDIWYVDNISLELDVKIMFLTIVKVFKREDISQGGQVSMTKFKGNR
jgi:undecaprenyl phosphate N,N'-diacetylbacillosamine 1-phosphate transferase